jgi:drug/metabolite transporter (DMT)-like permease
MNVSGDSNLKGIIFIVAAMATVPAMPAIAKLLSGSIPSGEAALARFAFQTLYLAPFAVTILGRRLLRPAQPVRLAVRGGLIATSTLLFFTALQVMPLADTTAIFFVQPFILAIVAAIFLGETIGWRRAVAIAVGFGGAMLIIRPSFSEFGFPALLPIGAALAVATYLAMTRRMGVAASVLEMQFHSGIAGMIVLGSALCIGTAAGIAPLTPVWPSPGEWLILAGLGVVATGSHLLMTKAFVYAPASSLAPFQYLEIIGATAYGLLLFGEFPDRLTWTGIAVIVSSGLFLIWREHRLRRPAASVPATSAGGSPVAPPVAPRQGGNTRRRQRIRRHRRGERPWRASSSSSVSRNRAPAFARPWPRPIAAAPGRAGTRWPCSISPAWTSIRSGTAISTPPSRWSRT